MRLKNIQQRTLIEKSNKEVALKCLHNSQESVDSLINKAKRYSTDKNAFQAFNYTRNSKNKEVALKYLYNSKNSIDFLINKAKTYQKKIFGRTICDIYGITQNPNTYNYILVLAWTSGNEKIDDFIQEMQLKINNENDVVFEWIPYRRRDFDKEVALKYLHTSENSIDFLINKTKKYSAKIFGRTICGIYGISQNPDTNNYILVLAWAIVFEWIPYHQFGDIEAVATGRQPFGDRAHDHCLALDICKGIRPEFNESEAPRCYISLMKKCWDLDKNDRPNIFEVDELITSFYKSYGGNLFKDLPKYDDDYNSQCLDQVI
ncbi:kinase-like domain-containing protein [Rhizophagus irregularis DAOM 181602=DAOM 197198]|nr:kinase-like domain-containing protein [Rhizophagus irregularis DAOM 181602=DAOM 197198]